MEIKLGQKAKDKITGFEGIIIGKCEYLTGCAQYGLTPKAKEGEKPLSTEWFDEGRIEIIGNGINAENVLSETKGGLNRYCPA